MNIKSFFKYYIFLYFLPIFIWGNNSIKEYNIELKLLQSGQIEVNQEIIYDFNTQQEDINFDISYAFKVGIYNRDIGIMNISLLRDGRVEKYKQTKINSKYIRVSTNTNRLKGVHRYNLFYTINRGVSNYNNKFDISRFNIINNFGLNIKRASINVILPYSLSNKNALIKTKPNSTIKWDNPNEAKIDIGSINQNKSKKIEIIYPINILKQNGKTNFSLSVKEQIFTTWNWFALFLISIFSYKYWILLGFDKFNKAIYSKYQPPSKLDILQSALLYNKVINNSIFTIAIIELAQKGYIDITKYDQSRPATLYKVDKDTKNLSYEMRYLLENILFSSERVINIKKKSNKQADKFLKGYKVITELIYAWSYREKYMQNSPKREKKLFLIKILTVTTPLILFSIYSSINLLGTNITLISLLHTILLIALMLLIVNGRTTTRILALISMVAISIPFTKNYIEIGLNNIKYTPIFLILFTYILNQFTYNKIGRYTRKGSIAKAYLDTIEKFINRATMKDIKKKLMQDPLYLDKYLPYAMLFNNSKKWVSFYHKLGVDTPKWYMGSEIYTLKYFYKDMREAITIDSISSKTKQKGKKI